MVLVKKTTSKEMRKRKRYVGKFDNICSIVSATADTS